MKILLLGKNGQVGWELQRTLLPIGEVVAPGRETVDLSNPGSMRDIVRDAGAGVIVNAAAYTAVDRAESEQELAFQVNAEAVGEIAEQARINGALLVHFSTDYIFDGNKSDPYVESDHPAPLSVYGRSKLQGEEYIHEAGCDFVILRTSWIYGVRGNNFLMTMIRLMMERRRLSIVNDQIGSPTWSRHVAETAASIIWQSCFERDGSHFDSGAYHLTSRGKASWYEFANEIARIAGAGSKGKRLMVEDIEPITSAEYPVPAKRPLNSLLDCEKLRKKFNVATPEWKHCLNLAMQDIC